MADRDIENFLELCGQVRSDGRVHTANVNAVLYGALAEAFSPEMMTAELLAQFAVRCVRTSLPPISNGSRWLPVQHIETKLSSGPPPRSLAGWITDQNGRHTVSVSTDRQRLEAGEFLGQVCVGLVGGRQQP